jgi:alkaline phosphatase
MGSGTVLKISSLLAAGLLLATAGAFLILYYFNTSFVFYRPGEVTSIHTPAIYRAPLPMLPDRRVKNVIVFIGDGMGVGQLAAARIHFVGPDGRLNIERMPVTGLVATHSVGNLLTDSAAGATALATGVKTHNKMVGVDPEGVRQLTVLEAARDQGMATGLVTSTELTDATPAAFASHVSRRKKESEIAVQLVQSRVNVLLGQGAYFFPRRDPRSLRDDALDPIALARERGYVVVESENALDTVASEYVLGLFEDVLTDRMDPEIRPGADSPDLAELTTKAIELLRRDPDGFFLVVEEEGPDKGGHVNREDYVLHYLRELDEAVAAALQFALQDQQTLVLVTADHETGGMRIVMGGLRARNDEFRRGYMEMAWSTDGHSGEPVPLFAFGPHAVRFTGFKDNTEIPKILAELLRLDGFAR